jgi:putative oxidoreductase
VTLSSGLGLALLRVTVGAICVMHAYLGLQIGPSGIGAYTVHMGYPATLAPVLGWYHILAHGIGGVLLILGLFTRWAALAQVPILASAFFLYHIRQGFFLTGIVDPTRGTAIAGGYEYILLILVATVTLVLAGGGALTLDRRSP